MSTPAPIAQQQDAHRYSTRDRDSAASLRLNAACRTAVAIIRLGRRHGDDDALREAERVLLIAGERAERVLGGVR